MKKLRIIVPTHSALNSYLADAGFIYDKIVRLSNGTCYKMNISKSLSLIDFLVSKFRPKDFYVLCHDDDVVTFHVYS